MKDHFVTYNQALTLKELGFNDDCFDAITKDKDSIVNAPLRSQVFQWFRKNHKLRHNVMDFIDDITGVEWDYEIATIGTDVDENGNYKSLVDYSIDDDMRKFKTYEEAESACIDKLIEIVKNK